MMNLAVSEKMKSILADISGQAFAIQNNTPYNADFTYDGDANTIQVTIYDKQWNTIYDGEQNFVFDNRAKRLESYRQFTKMRIKLLELYNQALCTE
jgi:hypothetical protein